MMLVVDSSAIIAILLNEPDAEHLARILESASAPCIPAPVFVEAAIVMLARKGDPGLAALDAFVRETGLTIADMTAAQATYAIDAFRRFGKGRHPAGLNLGDCYAYALASALKAPLLFKGEDFARTDILPAV